MSAKSNPDNSFEDLQKTLELFERQITNLTAELKQANSQQDVLAQLRETLEDRDRTLTSGFLDVKLQAASSNLKGVLERAWSDLAIKIAGLKADLDERVEGIKMDLKDVKEDIDSSVTDKITELQTRVRRSNRIANWLGFTTFFTGIMVAIALYWINDLHADSAYDRIQARQATILLYIIEKDLVPEIDSLKKIGGWDGVREHCETLLPLGSKHNLELRRTHAIACYKMGDFQAAEASYSIGFGLDSTDYSWLVDRAVTRIRIGTVASLTEAKSDLDTARVFIDDSADLFNRLAAIYYLRGDLLTAGLYLDTALERNSAHSCAYRNRLMWFSGGDRVGL